MHHRTKLLPGMLVACGVVFLVAADSKQAASGTNAHAEAKTASLPAAIIHERDEVEPEKHSPGSRADRLRLSKFRDWRTGDFSWAGPEISFTKLVKCKGTAIGEISFLFRPFKFFTRPPILDFKDYAGVALEGGFVEDDFDAPCPPDGYKPNTKFKWVQMVKTNDPRNGNPADTYYADVKAGVNATINPWYPAPSNDDKNPDGAEWTDGATYFDAPIRQEPAAVNTTWEALNMLVCTNGGKINVIASFEYGFSIKPPEDGEFINDEIVRFDEFNSPESYSEPPSAENIKTLAKLLKGDGVRTGFAVSTGCCCPKPKATESNSSEDGNTSTGFIVPENEALCGMAIFPRNHAIDMEALGTEVGGFFVEPSVVYGGAPRLPWQDPEDDPIEHLQEGVYLFPKEGIIMGPAEFTIDIPLTGHESFVDFYFLDSDFEWNPWVQNTDVLLGDMNADGQHDLEDFILLETAIFDPEEYQEQFPDINPIFAGDLTHNGSLNKEDMFLMEDLVFDVVEESDVVEIDDCPADVDGNGVTDVLDLLGVIAVWAPCPDCKEDTNEDDVVDVHDLLNVISNWGNCPDV